MAAIAACAPTILAQPTDPELNPTSGEVTWGLAWGARIKTRFTRTRHDSMKFYWTSEGEKHPDFGEYSEPVEDGRLYREFVQPYTNPESGQKPVTDYVLSTRAPGGGWSTEKIINVAGGARSWEPRPLDEIGPVQCRFAMLAPLDPQAGGEYALYAGVNLALYSLSNPNGFLDGAWQAGQSLNELDIRIVDGRLEGVEGLVFATSELLFDPLSEMGWVPSGGPSTLLNSDAWQFEFGELCIGSESIFVPGPGGLALLVLGGMACARRRR